jgi:putative RNA 2'-phosphotransferase
MSEEKYKKLSKFLSLVLRHKPETIGLKLDENGWAGTSELLEKLNQKDFEVSFELLQEVVKHNDKKRFVFSEDHTRIRASQGHSIQVDLQLEEQEPPALLYHGTTGKNIDSIKKQGILKGQRHHVHLSIDIETATNVGKRYGIPVILKVDALQMYKDGIKFYLSDNGVWLTDQVLPEYIKF